MTRASMLAVLGSDFIRTAHAMGLSRLRIVVAYALRNALLPVLTITGIVFSTMLGANVLVEKVFSWPGVRVLRARRPAGVGLCTCPGLRAADGVDLRAGERHDRRPLRHRRSQGVGRMSEAAVLPAFGYRPSHRLCVALQSGHRRCHAGRGDPVVRGDLCAASRALRSRRVGCPDCAAAAVGRPLGRNGPAWARHLQSHPVGNAARSRDRLLGRQPFVCGRRRDRRILRLCRRPASIVGSAVLSTS